MIGGWFIGHFSPTALQTSDFEVGVKEYKAGAKEKKHYHLQAIEFTVIVSGSVIMNGIPYEKGDIVLIEKGEATDFEAVTDVTTLVVKTPSVPDDKFLV